MSPRIKKNTQAWALTHKHELSVNKHGYHKIADGIGKLKLNVRETREKER